jgi:methyl-accepting chemotaxis protein
MAQHQRDFVQALGRWQRELPEGPMRSVLLDEVVPPARTVFDLVNDRIVPASAAGDLLEVRTVLDDDMLPAYLEHREAVERLVGLAEQAWAGAEIASDDTVARRVWTLLGVVAAFAASSAVAGWWLARSVRRPLHQLAEATAKLAAGDAGNVPRLPEGPDEVGRTAAAINRSVAGIIAMAGVIGDQAAGCRRDADRLEAVGGADLAVAAAGLRGRADGLEAARARFVATPTGSGDEARPGTADPFPQG